MRIRNRYICLWATMAAACAAVSCHIEEAEVIGIEDISTIRYVDLVLTAQQEEGETRTVLSSSGNGTDVLWSPGDAISVICGGLSSRLQTLSSMSAASTSATFIGSLPINVGTNGSEGDDVWGVYPYSDLVSMSGGYVTTVLPSVQTAKAGSFADNLMILLGNTQLSSANLGQSTVQLTMGFKNVCSGIRFKVSRSGIKSVTMTATGGENLCGTVQLEMSNGNPSVPVVHQVINGSPTIEVNAPDGGFATNTWYYIVTLPCTLNQGATFTITTSTQFGSRSVGTSGFTLTRGVFSQIPNLSDGITMEDLDMEVQVAAPDTWIAEDELERRVMPTNPSTPRSNKEVLMFYWPWHESVQVDYSTIVNISSVIRTYPEALSNFFHPAWGAAGQISFWGQPLFGYYRTTDPWVLRKHAELLADAGVDAVVFDMTNGRYTWWSSVTELMAVWEQARQQGVKVPKIVFMSNLVPCEDSAAVLRALYLVLYQTGSYQNLWYYVDGKPLILAFPASLNFNPESYDSNIRSFFTWRAVQYDYVTDGDHYVYDAEPTVPPQWGWLQVYPQNSFNNNEQMPVGVAQNACPESGGHAYAFNATDGNGYYTTYGRSYTKADGQSKRDADNGSFVWGYNFQEQWNRALSFDPHFVFVTGWNEWIAGRYPRWPDPDDNPTYGYTPVAFPDQFDWERSRDIEPNAEWGDYGDCYYYQLANNVRKFKGVSAYPNVSRKTTIPIDGTFTEWANVSPDFKHYPGNTMHRAHLGHTNSGLAYYNSTGRNDIVDAKVTRDSDYLYFYVETNANMTSYTDAKWMRLFINIDCSWATGWKGYDYCLNYRNPASSSQGYVSRCRGTSWSWSDAGSFDYQVVGNKMEIRVARTVLGLTSASRLDFAFKWADNNMLQANSQETANILNFYVDGDAAPGGRFNFHYVEP